MEDVFGSSVRFVVWVVVRGWMVGGMVWWGGAVEANRCAIALAFVIRFCSSSVVRSVSFDDWWFMFVVVSSGDGISVVVIVVGGGMTLGADDGITVAFLIVSFE